jgi:hypothetical protein
LTGPGPVLDCRIDRFVSKPRWGGLFMTGNVPKLDPLAVARAAGLDQVVSQFPDDIAAAVQAVTQDLADFPAIEGTTEPWPPMQIRSAR